MSERTRHTQADTEALANRLTKEIRERDARRAAQELARSTATSSRQRACQAGLAVGVPLLIAILVMNLTGTSWRSLFESRPPDAVARYEATRLLDRLVVDIEAFRKDYDALPERLDEIGLPERGTWTYTATGGGHYRIQGTVYDQRVSFDSSPVAGPSGAP